MTNSPAIEQAITDYLAEVLSRAVADGSRHYTVRDYDPAGHTAVIVWDTDQSCTDQPETTYVDLAALDKAFDTLAGSVPDDWRDDDDRMVSRQDGQPLNMTVIARDHLYGSYSDLAPDALADDDLAALVEIAAFGRLVFTDLDAYRCERCGEVVDGGSFDKDCGLCATCTANNDTRVVL